MTDLVKDHFGGEAPYPKPKTLKADLVKDNFRGEVLWGAAEGPSVGSWLQRLCKPKVANLHRTAPKRFGLRVSDSGFRHKRKDDLDITGKTAS